MCPNVATVHLVLLNMLRLCLCGHWLQHDIPLIFTEISHPNAPRAPYYATLSYDCKPVCVPVCVVGFSFSCDRTAHFTQQPASHLVISILQLTM